MANWATPALKLALAVALLLAIAWKLDAGDVIRTLLSIAPQAIVLVLLTLCIQSLFAAARLSAVVALYRRYLPWRISLRVTLEGMFFGQTFVSFLGGDAVRIWRMRSFGLSLEEATAAVVFDRLIGIIVNHVLVLAALPWLLGTITTGAVRLGLIVLAAAGVAGIAVVLLLAVVPGRLGLFRRLPENIQTNRLVQLALSTAMIGRHLLRPNWYLAQAIVLALLMALANCVAFFVLLLGWGIAPSVAMGCALLTPALLQIAMLPITVAGWGVREATAIVAFGSLGVPAQIALGSSVIFALVMLAYSLIGGALWVADRRVLGDLGTIEHSPASADATVQRTARNDDGNTVPQSKVERTSEGQAKRAGDRCRC